MDSDFLSTALVIPQSPSMRSQDPPLSLALGEEVGGGGGREGGREGEEVRRRRRGGGGGGGEVRRRRRGWRERAISAVVIVFDEVLDGR